MDHEDKDSKTYVVKIKKHDTRTPEEFLRWRLVLKEDSWIQWKLRNGYEFSASDVGWTQFRSIFE
jgi:hypothetical protein